MYVYLTHSTCLNVYILGSPFPTFSGPNMSDPYISGSVQVKHTYQNPFNATIFSIDCKIKTNETDAGAQYYILFYANNHIVAALNGPNTTITIEEKHLVGELGKEVK